MHSVYICRAYIHTYHIRGETEGISWNHYMWSYIHMFLHLSESNDMHDEQ